MAALERQTSLLSAFGIFTYPFACVPVLFFYFEAHGIELDQYMWLIAVYYWAMVLTEIPTGIFADRFGRKSSLVAGTIMLAAGFITIYLGDNFEMFCVGEVLFGVGHSLLSGAPTAMLYDSLKEHDRETDFLRIESRIHALRLFGTGGSFLIGGVIAYRWGIEPTILLTAIFSLVGAGIALFLRESKHAVAQDKPPILKAALRDLRSHALIWVLIYFVILFGLLRFAFHTYQPYFKETVFAQDAVEHNWLVLGILFAALNFVAAPCSRLAPRLKKRFRYRALFLWMLLSLCAAFLLMAWLPISFADSNVVKWVGVILFFAHQVPFGLHWALIQDFVNTRVATVSRATALSILSFSGRITFALWLPVVGVYQKANGTPNTYLLLGCVGVALTFVWCSPWLGARLLAKDAAN